MIDFPCRCGHKFSLDDDMSARQVQCPACGLLVDVPSREDRTIIEPDGTYKLDLPTEQEEADRFAELKRTFSRAKVDEQGHEYDLRNTPEQIYSAGAEEVPLQQKDELRPGMPKYDPETGELIRPMEVRRDAGPRIPYAKPAPLSYHGGGGELPLSGWWLPLRLFLPLNMIVMTCVMVLHGVMHLGPMLLFLAWIVPPLCGLVILMHYGNVIDETGPAGKDELPRPLRDLSYDDLWAPLKSMVIGLVLSFGPALAASLLHLHGPARTAPVALLAGAGLLLLPAILLTTATSGTILNLAPRRVASVIRACGLGYAVAALLAAPAVLLYAWDLFGTRLLPELWQYRYPLMWRLLDSPIMLGPLIVAAAYFAHLFCWYLGVLYRRHSAEFDWVWQYHQRRMDDRAAQIRVMAEQDKTRKAPAARPVQPPEQPQTRRISL